MIYIIIVSTGYNYDNTWPCAVVYRSESLPGPNSRRFSTSTHMLSTAAPAATASTQTSSSAGGSEEPCGRARHGRDHAAQSAIPGGVRMSPAKCAQRCPPMSPGPAPETASWKSAASRPYAPTSLLIGYYHYY